MAMKRNPLLDRGLESGTTDFEEGAGGTGREVQEAGGGRAKGGKRQL